MADTKKVPELNQPEKETPDLAQATKEVQDTTVQMKEVPSLDVQNKEMPSLGNTENMVAIGDTTIEIKPMKLKYQRNRTAVFYHVLDKYPLPDILAMENPFGDGRDGDKALCDWLVAATDDEDLVREHIDDFDSDTIYKILEIFRRLNRIDAMEEKLKNAKAPGEKKA